MSESCERLGKFFGGCHFEARYSKPQAVYPDKIETTVDGACRYVEASRPVIYEGDVCIRCGKRSMKVNNETTLAASTS